MSEKRKECPVEYLEKSEELVGYKTKIWRKDAFKITGYTIIVPPNIVPPKADPQTIPQFWSDVMADGSFETLAKASSVPPWILGLGSWDPECEPGGQRYTICLEETEHTDLSNLSRKHQLHTQRFEACDWMCFEMDGKQLWKDDPYTMLRKLGYRFHLRVGVHFDAYPPGYHPETNPLVELWISVAKPSEACDICSVRAACAEMQPFE